MVHMSACEELLEAKQQAITLFVGSPEWEIAQILDIAQSLIEQ